MTLSNVHVFNHQTKRIHIGLGEEVSDELVEVSIAADNEGGVVLPFKGTEHFNDAANVFLSAVPEEGWVFDKWEINGDLFHEQELIYTLEGDTDVMAHFAEEEICEPEWSPVGNLQFNMQLVGQLIIDDQVSVNPGDMVGAFVDGECRGIASPDDDGYVSLTIGSNVQEGETVELLIWNSELCEVCETFQTLSFENLAQIGTLAEPYLVDCGADEDHTLSLEFDEGYTWFSVNVNPGSMDVNEVFADLSPCENDRIIGQTAFAIF